MSVTANSFTPPPRPRLIGLDVARGLALVGMVLVNFELALGAYGKGPTWLAHGVHALQGKAAATFVLLAGIGASLGARRAWATDDPESATAERRRARQTLLRRAGLLFVGGCAFLLVWSADILHFYGVWMAIGSALLFASTRTIFLGIVGLLAANSAHLLWGQPFAHWNLFTLEYQGLAEPARFARHLFLNGWHPVVPWLALYLIGMLVGRWDLADGRVQKRLLCIALPVAILGHAAEDLWVPEILFAVRPIHLLSTDSFPPTPTFVLTGAAVAVAVIVGACWMTQRFPKGPWLPLVCTGQLALTLYVAHVLVGLGTLEALGRLENQSLPFAVGAGLVFSILALLCATLWRRRFARGPLEALLRRWSSA